MRIAAILFIVLFVPAQLLAEGSSWQVAKSTHFNLFYKNASESTVNEMIQKAENCYDSIAEDLGFSRFNFWTWDNRAKIYLFDSQDEYKKATQSYDWSGGQVSVRNKVIQTFVGSPAFLNNILPHELGHIVFLEMVGFNNRGVPLWLQEGVAAYQEQDIRLVKIELAKRIKNGDYIIFDKLNSFSLNSSAKDVRLFYAESYSIVKYLITRFGKEEFVNFCRTLRDSQNLITALSRAYSFNNLSELEEGWREYILE